jgi:hypothetical protein
MANTIDNSEDYLDVRGIIARVEELESELVDGEELSAETAKTRRDEAEQKGDSKADDWSEAYLLLSLLEDMRGCGGDEQWRGDWYPVTLIRDSYFETAMDELLEDIGDMPKNIPSYLKITVDYDALQMDYSSVEFDGVTYWYR